jgi:RNA polymerase sigma factor (sigma-70 family)
LDSLVEPARSGNSQALSALVRGLQGPLYRLARRMLVSSSDAEDATQEILVKVVTHLGEFEARSGILTWAYAIAVRHLMRARASKAEQRAVSPEQMATMLDTGLGFVASETLSKAEARVFEREIRLSCTHAILVTLSRDERIAVILADVLHLESPVASALCEITPEAFRQRLTRGRARLKPILEERCGLVDPANPCHCAKQIPAKRSLGMRREKLIFAKESADAGADADGADDLGAERLERAAQQMRGLERAAVAFHVDPPLEPPKSLWTRMQAAFPELLT